MFSHEFTLHLGSPLRCRGFPSVVDPWLPNKNSSSLFWKQSLNFLRGTLPPRVLRVWAEPTPVVVLRTPLGRGEYPSHREWLTDDRKRPIRAPDHLSRSLAENPGKGQVLLLVGMQSTQNVSVRLPQPGGVACWSRACSGDLAPALSKRSAVSEFSWFYLLLLFCLNQVRWILFSCPQKDPDKYIT